MVLFCFGQLPAFPLTGMTSDGPPGHFVQGFWSPVWWQCFGDRRHKCSSTEFASARRTVNSFIICQKPWTKEFWTVFLSSVRSDLFCMAPSANPRIVVFVRSGCLFAKPEEQSLIVRPMVFDPCTNTPGLGPSTIYSLPINKLSHWRCGVPCQVWLPEETFFFQVALTYIMILCFFGTD